MYRIDSQSNNIVQLEEKRFGELGFTERGHLQGRIDSESSPFPSSIQANHPPALRRKRTNFLAQSEPYGSFGPNTRAVPLVRKEDAHQGRVSFCPDAKALLRGDAIE